MQIQSRRDVFHAIADPTRRHIIDLTTAKQLNLNSIADNFNMSRPAVSQHIKILEECGLIQVTQLGRERFCRAKPEKLKEVTDWADGLRKIWDIRFNSLENLLDNSSD